MMNYKHLAKACGVICVILINKGVQNAPHL